MADVKIINTGIEITIPVSGMVKLIEYEQGVRGLLKKVEVGNCDPELIESIKTVYELLSHIKLINKKSLRLSKVMLQS